MPCTKTDPCLFRLIDRTSIRGVIIGAVNAAWTAIGREAHFVSTLVPRLLYARVNASMRPNNDAFAWRASAYPVNR